VSLTNGNGPPVYALTAVVNRHGALLLSSSPYLKGSVVVLHNERSETVRCRVVWLGEPDASGAHKVGIEFIDDAPTFWGRLYEEQIALLADDKPGGAET
jgi:hypothetical protein